ncbi:hypothetical protein [Cellulosimicrobium sp. Marseille-Q4280]|uniref:LppM family (lipo)protein n=1 Tax=Cellulosimicrobium sp. Marseille-Q4280 TaxID=2937992 RepID=UPI00203FAE10|nr:hypothetical protein [Cellulosimicrobium sp. Marseille-Q4280]
MNPSPLRKRLGLGALLATLALFLAGCMRIDMDLTLNEDDTADGTIVMAISDETAEALGQDPQALWDQMGSEMEGELPPGATQEPYAEDGYTGTRMTYTGQPISDMSTGATDELSITREGDEFVVSGSMDMSDEEMGMDGTDPESDEMTRQMMEGFEVSISITFPGEVAETNGEVDGNTVTWTPVIGEVTELSARGSAVAGGAAADPGDGTTDGSTDGSDDGTDDGTTGSSADSDGDEGSGFPWWVLGLVGGLLLLAIIGLVLWLVLRKKPDAQDGDAGLAQGGYPGQPGAPQGQYPGQYPGQPGPPQGQYPGQPGQYAGQPGQYPGQPGQYPGQPGQQPPAAYPGQQGQPGQYPPQQGGYPGQQGRPGQYPPQQGGYPGQQPGPQGQQSGPQGQYPPAPGQQPGRPGTPQGPYAPPQGQQPGYPGAPGHPQQAPTTPYQQGPATTQPLPPQPGPVPPAPTQPLPPQPGAAASDPGRTGPGNDDGDDEIDDATRLRPPT